MSRQHNHDQHAVPDPSGYGQCFGCSPRNPIGLCMVFADRQDGVQSALTLGVDYESYPGVIHGGIVATILDEAMARAALRIHRRPASTIGMRVRYARPMESAKLHTVIAEVEATDGRDDGVIRVRGRVEAEGQALVAVADGTFMLWTEERVGRAQADLPPAAAQSLQQFLKDVR